MTWFHHNLMVLKSGNFGNKTRSLRTKQSYTQTWQFERFLLWQFFVNHCVLSLRIAFAFWVNFLIWNTVQCCCRLKNSYIFRFEWIITQSLEKLYHSRLSPEQARKQSYKYFYINIHSNMSSSIIESFSPGTCTPSINWSWHASPTTIYSSNIIACCIKGEFHVIFKLIWINSVKVHVNSKSKILKVLSNETK